MLSKSHSASGLVGAVVGASVDSSNRQLIDRAKPAISGGAETGQFYSVVVSLLALAEAV
jgi:hypothetical protein